MFEQNVYYSSCFIPSGGNWLEVSQRFINTYIQSQLNFFDRDSWTRLKLFPLQLQQFITNDCLASAHILHFKFTFDLLADTKPKMTAAVDKGLHLVKSRQYNHRTRDITSSN